MSSIHRRTLASAGSLGGGSGDGHRSLVITVRPGLTVRETLSRMAADVGLGGEWPDMLMTDFAAIVTGGFEPDGA